MLPYIELEFRTGKLEGSTTNLDEKTATELLKSGPVRFSAVDTEFEYLVTVGEDKKLKVWELDGPKLRSQRFVLAPAFTYLILKLHTRDLPKRPTSLSLTRDGRTILVSDKFGDIFR